MFTDPPPHAVTERDRVNVEILHSLKNIDQKLDTSNKILSQLVTSFQSWRQIDISRGPLATSIPAPEVPRIQSAASSDEDDELNFLYSQSSD
jgi:hypothetical protein